MSTHPMLLTRGEEPLSFERLLADPPKRLINLPDRSVLEVDEKFRIFIEYFPTAAILTDQKGKIVLVNSLTTETFGYKREELLGQLIEMLIPQRFGEGQSANFAGLGSHSRADRMGSGLELCALRKDGCEFQVEVSTSHIQIDANLLILSTITDISDRRRSEQALIDMNVQIARG
jgi:PAS domain S-box-containing protein